MRVIHTAVDHHGRLDVLVANAGIIPLGDILESSVEDWDHAMAIDGRGMWLTCKYAVEAMLLAPELDSLHLPAVLAATAAAGLLDGAVFWLIVRHFH